MKKTMALAVLVVLVAGVFAPQSLWACESCYDDFTCLSTMTGAKACAWVERCRIVVIGGTGMEFCWTVCKQTDFTCSVRPDGPPPV